MSTLKVSTIAPLGTDATNTVSLQAGAKTSGFGKEISNKGYAFYLTSKYAKNIV